MVDDLVAIAKIARPHGLRGDVVADILTDFPERFDDLENVIGLSSVGERRELTIEKARFQKDRLLLKLSGIDAVEEAEALRGFEICIPEAEAVELDADEFFDWQLAGCTVETIDNVTIGMVKELMRTGGTEVLVVAGADKEYLIPFAVSICIEVDVETKRIVIDPPEGLLDF
jgi:16S rRNA processing protein RimM